MDWAGEEGNWAKNIFEWPNKGGKEMDWAGKAPFRSSKPGLSFLPYPPSVSSPRVRAPVPRPCPNAPVRLSHVQSLDKKQQLLLTCKACGHITKADSQHKLLTFIINHPPNGGTVDGKAGKKSKEERRKEKAEKNAASGKTTPKSTSDDEDEDPEDGGMQFTPVVLLGQTSSNGDAASVDASSSAVDIANTSILSDGGVTPPTGAGAADDGGDEFSVDEETLQRARESTLGNLTDAVRQTLVLERTGSPAPSGTKSPANEAGRILAGDPDGPEGMGPSDSDRAQGGDRNGDEGEDLDAAEGGHGERGGGLGQRCRASEGPRPDFVPCLRRCVLAADPYDTFADYLGAGMPTAEGIKDQTRFLDDEKVRGPSGPSPTPPPPPAPRF